MIVLVEYILSELTHPFKDPRTYRTPDNLDITNAKLFYMLIDESERSFKRGMIVTATVTKVLDNLVFCKLDNGLDAIIQRNDLDKSSEKL
jgi:transcriptional accessory protein Tex/SPT6